MYRKKKAGLKKNCKMKSPLVSVIIPTYNNGRFISFALESLFRQTYPEENTEIIVVDDGSTDNTPEVLEEFREKIIYVRQENNGIASARNTGMSTAKGEIITFLDSDDMWNEDRLQRIVEKFYEKQDAGMVYHPIELIDSKGNTIHKNFYKTFGYNECLSGRVTKEIFSGQIFCGGSSFAFKREIIDKLYPVPKDIKRGVDYYMTSVAACYATVEYIPDILGKYRLHGTNTTMFADHDNYEELSLLNKDFADMREKTIEKMLRINTTKKNNAIDVNIIKRIQTKEMIFYNVLNGKRWDGIKRIPFLFKGNPSVKDLFRGIAVSFMALLIPVPLYSKLLKVHELLIRLVSGE